MGNWTVKGSITSFYTKPKQGNSDLLDHKIQFYTVLIICYPELPSYCFLKPL